MAKESKTSIQKFNDARNFIRSFFIYGYKHTEKVTERKSTRINNSYIPKIKNWFENHCAFYWQENTTSAKNITESENKTKEATSIKIPYIAVDSHDIDCNPFYTPLKAITFNDNQISLHFYLLSSFTYYKKAMEQSALSETQLCSLPDEERIDADGLLESLSMKSFAKGLSIGNLKTIIAEKRFLPFENGLYFFDDAENDAAALQQYIDKKIIKHNNEDDTYSFGEYNLFLDIYTDPKSKAYSPTAENTLEEMAEHPIFSALFGKTITEIKNTLTPLTKKSGKKTPSILIKDGICTFKQIPFELNPILDNNRFTKEEIEYIIANTYDYIFSSPNVTDDILKNTLKDYVNLGILKLYPGNPNRYALNDNIPINDSLIPAIQFFSEIGHLGFFGSTILDLQDKDLNTPFVFKHHYLANALNTEIIHSLLYAMQKKLLITISLFDSIKINTINNEELIVPLRLYRSVETGRIYLFCYSYSRNQYAFFLLDDIDLVKLKIESQSFKKELDLAKNNIKREANSKIICLNYDAILKGGQEFTKHIWSMSTSSYANYPAKPIDVEVVFHVEDYEYYIIARLNREKRQGTLTKIDANTYRYNISLYNPKEMFPWLRSYITRIVNITFSDKALEKKFWDDFNCLANIYNLTKEEE